MFDLDGYDDEDFFVGNYLFDYIARNMTREEYTKEIATLMGIEEDIVETFLTALELVVLNNLKKKGNMEAEEFYLNLPILGQLFLKTSSRGGYDMFEYEFIVDAELMKKMRKSYYEQENYLLDTVENNFKDVLLEKTKNLIG